MNVAAQKIRDERSLLGQFVWLVSRRPQHVLRALYTYFQFSLASILRWIPSARWHGVTLGENVRLQRNSSIMAERPQGKIAIGSHAIVYEHAKVEAYGQGVIEIGEASILGEIQIVSRHHVSIGKRFLSSWNVFIQDYDSHPVSQSSRRAQVQRMAATFRPRFRSKAPLHAPEYSWNFPGEEIVIGDDVWIGANATILKGARIGSGSIVATAAVVLKGEYPPRSLIAGNPAVVVKEVCE